MSREQLKRKHRIKFFKQLLEKIEDYQLIAFKIDPDMFKFQCLCNGPECNRSPLSQPVELSRFDKKEYGR